MWTEHRRIEFGEGTKRQDEAHHRLFLVSVLEGGFAKGVCRAKV
jgi:hypothetical protein